MSETENIGQAEQLPSELHPPAKDDLTHTVDPDEVPENLSEPSDADFDGDVKPTIYQDETGKTVVEGHPAPNSGGGGMAGTVVHGRQS